jgi:hypothetical protein
LWHLRSLFQDREARSARPAAPEDSPLNFSLLQTDRYSLELPHTALQRAQPRLKA